jgi:hypothetical protein
MMAGRTFTFIHKGDKLLVCEGQDNTVEFRIGKHRQTPSETRSKDKFVAACKEAVVYMLANAGGMKGNYER